MHQLCGGILLPLVPVYVSGHEVADEEWEGGVDQVLGLSSELGERGGKEGEGQDTGVEE